MDELEHPQGLDEKLYTGAREDDGSPIMRFPQIGDLDVDVFFDEDLADECIRKQKSADMPNEKNAVASMKGIFALAQAEQNDLIKNGWDVDFTEKKTITPDVIDAVIDRFKEI